MNHRRRLTLGLIVSVSAASIGGAAARAQTAVYTPVAQWTASDGGATTGGVRMTDALGGNTIAAVDGAQVTPVKDGLAGPAIRFDGAQTKAATSQRSVDLGAGARFTLKARVETGVAFQTLLAVYGKVELRYFQNRKTLGLLVWPADGSKAVEVHAPFAAGRWTQIVATVDGDTLTLDVNGKSVQGALPAGVGVKPGGGKISLGLISDRPLTGALADIRLETR